MSRFLPIADPADPRVAIYANLKDRQLSAMGDADDDSRTASGKNADAPSGLGGFFMAEGELVVRTLAHSAYQTHSLLLTPTRLQTMRDAIDALPTSTPVYLVEQPVMDQIVGFHIHRGVLAAARRPPVHVTHDLDRLLAPPSPAAAPRVLVVLEDLANHDNVGGIFRSVAALIGPANSGVVLSPACCDPLYRKSIRVSIGAALLVPWAAAPRSTPWAQVLSRVKQAGYTLVALALDPRARDLRDIDPAKLSGTNARPGSSARIALLLGAEGPGLSPESLAQADVVARIPMDPSMDSLNVSVAAGIALHWLGRL